MKIQEITTVRSRGTRSTKAKAKKAAQVQKKVVVQKSQSKGRGRRNHGVQLGQSQFVSNPIPATYGYGVNNLPAKAPGGVDASIEDVEPWGTVATGPVAPGAGSDWVSGINTGPIPSFIFRPGSSGIPRLDQTAAQYELWRLVYCIICFIPETGTAANLSLAQAIDYDADDLPSENNGYFRALDHRPGMMNQIYTATEIPVQPDRVNRAKWMFTTAGGATHPGLDAGFLYYWSLPHPTPINTDYGRVFVRYKVEFSNPIPPTTVLEGSNAITNFVPSSITPGGPAQTPSTSNQVNTYGYNTGVESALPGFFDKPQLLNVSLSADGTVLTETFNMTAVASSTGRIVNGPFGQRMSLTTTGANTTSGAVLGGTSTFNWLSVPSGAANAVSLASDSTISSVVASGIMLFNINSALIFLATTALPIGLYQFQRVTKLGSAISTQISNLVSAAAVGTAAFGRIGQILASGSPEPGFTRIMPTLEHVQDPARDVRELEKKLDELFSMMRRKDDTGPPPDDLTTTCRERSQTADLTSRILAPLKPPRPASQATV